MSRVAQTSVDARRAAISRYLEKRQFYPLGVADKPPGDLDLVVVIPCFDEPDIESVLDSLGSCEAPNCSVEVLVIVNAPRGADPKILSRNQAAAQCVRDWQAPREKTWLRVRLIEHNDLPPRRAGVGLARKIGLDEAVARLRESTNADGIIVCLDADCLVAANYLVASRQFFASNPHLAGASIYFEHPEILDKKMPIARAMVEYELHLRCYIAGQRSAGFPYAYHTVGSTIACRASDYVAQGGMNLRQGGEDFYFAQKLIAARPYSALNGTIVYPGVRRSRRVPFGTGPALERALTSRDMLRTFAPPIYRDLREFCDCIRDESPAQLGSLFKQLPSPLVDFLREQRFRERIDEIHQNVRDEKSFRKRIFRWFNAFRFLKYAQASSRKYYPKVSVVAAAAALADESIDLNTHRASEWLRYYREQDRQT